MIAAETLRRYGALLATRPGLERKGEQMPSPIDAYLAGLPADQRDALQRVRAELHRLVPDAEESMGYGMPVIKHNGQGVLWFAGWKKHLSIYPLTDSFLAAHEAELEGYDRTKGSLHFSPDAPLPSQLFEELVRARLEDLVAGTA